MSLVRCELAVTQLMKQLKGDRLTMRRIRVIKPKMYACLVRGWLTPSLMTPIREEREAGRSWNREIRNAKVGDSGGAPVVASVSCPWLCSDWSPFSPGRSPSATSTPPFCACPLPVTGGKGEGGTLPCLFSHTTAGFSNCAPRQWG